MAHRHANALDVAEAQLKSISEDAVSKRRSVEERQASGTSQDARQGDGTWDFLGLADGIRIYTKSSTGKTESVAPGHASDTSLPYFRGEGIIEGDWNLSDVLATVASPGARDVWDERFRAGNSQLVAILCAPPPPISR